MKGYLAQIWQANTQLQGQADSLGNFYAPILEDWTLGGTQAHNTLFTSERYQEIDNLIGLIYPDASFELRADLDQLRSYLQGNILEEVPGIVRASPRKKIRVHEIISPFGRSSSSVVPRDR